MTRLFHRVTGVLILGLLVVSSAFAMKALAADAPGDIGLHGTFYGIDKHDAEGAVTLNTGSGDVDVSNAERLFAKNMRLR